MATIIIFSIPLLKYIILLAFLNFVVHVSGHIYNKTFDYRKSLDFLIKLTGYIIVILVFTILACAEMETGIHISFISFDYVLYTVFGMILLKYSRDILDGLIIWGVDVAKFIPFLKNSQVLLMSKYNINDACSISEYSEYSECKNREIKNNLW
jgi:hypothetical protein